MDQSTNHESGYSPATINFLHIPKTAGITFNSLLASLFNEDEIYVSGVFQLIAKLKQGEQFDNTPYKYFRAHLQYAPYFFTKPVNYVTMFREPEKQVISSFKQMIRSSSEPNHYVWRDIRSFKDIFSSITYGSGYWNLQTRMVAGYIFAYENPFVEYGGNRPFDDPLFLDKAIENLEKFTFFGITSRFNDSLDLLEKKLGCVLERTSRKNVTPEFADYKFTEEDIELIKEKNELDIKLYEYAATRFAEEYDLMKNEINAKEQTKSVVSISSSKSTDKIAPHNIKSTVKATKDFLGQLTKDWKNLSIMEYNPYFGLVSGSRRLKNYVPVFQFSEEAAEFISKKDIINGNPVSLEFPADSFDVVICLDTIDCVEAPIQVLKEFLRVLRYDGKLILSVPTKKFVNDDRLRRWRASEIEGKYQPLYPSKYRQSAIGSDMLIAQEFSKNLPQIFGRWTNQPVWTIDVPASTEETKLVIIHKKYMLEAVKFEEIRLRELTTILERKDISLQARLNVYHEIALMQQKIIDVLLAEITKFQFSISSG